MSAVIAIHWTESALHYVVLAQQGQIQASGSVAVAPETEPLALGPRLAEALAPYSPARAKVIVAVDRNALEWQHLSLPPCPSDELPELVRMQSDRDLNSSDKDLGFDFLPLVGDEQTPYQVLTVTLTPSELTTINEVFRAANLSLEHLVPLAVGWPAITQQATPCVNLGTNIFIGLQANEATLWATRSEHVVLFRQFQLPSTADPADLAPAIGSELRRTLLVLSQHPDRSTPKVSLVGNSSDQLSGLANTLNDQLEVTVQTLEVVTQHPNLDSSATTTLPLVGLANAVALGNQPLVDLLHPRRSPQKQIDVRTYALAATAGALLLALFGWLSYAKLQAPLHQAEADRAELTLLEEPLDALKEDEQQAASIRDWKAEAPNFLIHLQQISQCLRPKALDAEDFSVDQDVVLDKLQLDKRELRLGALARNSKAVTPLEDRLRAVAYGAQRGKSDLSKTLKDYPWSFQSLVTITSASDNADRQANEDETSSTPTEEPPS